MGGQINVVCTKSMDLKENILYDFEELFLVSQALVAMSKAIVC